MLDRRAGTGLARVDALLASTAVPSPVHLSLAPTSCPNSERSSHGVTPIRLEGANQPVRLAVHDVVRSTVATSATIWSIPLYRGM